MKNIKIFWFRQDLRISDNPALHEASKTGSVLPIYIHDNKNPKDYCMGSTSQCWLYYSLNSLNSTLKNKLSFYIGEPINILTKLIDEYQINGVVILKNIIDDFWLQTLLKGIKKNFENVL